MNVSLKFFLRTGHLGDLRYGMSRDEVTTLLGTPDATGGTSCKYPQPCLWLYGTVELNFRQQCPGELISLYWDAGGKGLFFLASDCVIQDWAFTPAWTFAQVEDYLHEHEIPFDYRDSPVDDPQTPAMTTASGVGISFAEGRIYSLYGGEPGPTGEGI